MNTRQNKNAKRLLQIGACIAFVCSLFNLYLANVITVTSDMPDTIQYGATVPVTITINKGDIEGFGRFTCTLPKEYIATSEDQNFTFENNTVTLVWVMLPESDAFSFTFNVIVPEKTKSSFTLVGKFGYVQDNEKRFAELTPRSIKVTDNGGSIIAKTDKVNYNNIYCYRTIEMLNNEAIVSITTNKDNANSMCKIEEMLPSGFTVKPLETNNSEMTSIQNVARFMWVKAPEAEKFTITYKVIADKGTNINDLVINGAFTIFDNGATKSFVITDNYNAISESTGTISNATESHPITIASGANNGYYSSASALQSISDKNYTQTEASFFANTDALNTIYQPTKAEINQFEEELNIPMPTVENAAAEAEKEYEITKTTETTTTSEIASTKDNPDLIKNILSNQSTKPVISTIDAEPSQITQTTTQKTTQVTTTTTTITPINQEKVLEPKSSAAKTTVATTNKSQQKSNVTLSNKNNTIQKETKVSAGKHNVSYRVQVAASHKPLKNSKTFFAKRNINEKVTSEKIDTWYKYTITSHDTYVNARNQRNKIWEQTPIKGAFVVAYNGQKRITVQEALMLTNQKWVK